MTADHTPEPTRDGALGEADREALRAAAEAATPGPWEHAFRQHVVKDSGRHTCGTGPDGHFGAHEPGCGLDEVAQAAEQDAAHIAAFDPPTALALLDRVTQAETERDRLQDGIEALADEWDDYARFGWRRSIDYAADLRALLAQPATGATS